jgi:hypothetical protein
MSSTSMKQTVWAMVVPTTLLLLHRAVSPVDGRNHPRFVTDSADVVTAVARFHSALAAGDSATALTILADDVLVLESGSVETRADYRAHHLSADIEFARSVPSKRTVTRVTVSGAATTGLA